MRECHGKGGAKVDGKLHWADEDATQQASERKRASFQRAATERNPVCNDSDRPTDRPTDVKPTPTPRSRDGGAGSFVQYTVRSN
ncbi:hypothetical protein ZHAS_00007811 [Anopheles sinensis]|uniref:Uncharacterized protein n=1 Tax=Anopheles sinensis TaxID=74873 RepID=A0A084VQS8_ANOSI|nr:hypothetical protein ZHAS_00007811 [Anopheles sinensis]